MDGAHRNCIKNAFPSRIKVSYCGTTSTESKLTQSFKWRLRTRRTSREISGELTITRYFGLNVHLNDLRPRLPKKHELFVFFRITNPQLFKTHLALLAPQLTTARDAERYRSDIYKKKAQGTLQGLIHLSAINVAFSAKGLKKVSHEITLLYYEPC
jgi:hypothetical protein